MSKLIRKLYHGAIVPHAKSYGDSKIFRERQDAVLKLEDELRSKLNDSTFEVLQNLISAVVNAEEFGAEEQFVDGFKLGLGLAVESLANDNSELLEKLVAE